ncbi:hypothetical protein QT397_04880 [Microbulbifer sp. MKSA007]|nr:hypothetical protein QT397_04880 [Microbulbifer sp. MKSA007]
MESIVSNGYDFAAIKADGSVVTWGFHDNDSEKNSSSASDQLTSGVLTIVTSGKAFSAIKDDKSVVTWGDSSFGADSSDIDFN